MKTLIICGALCCCSLASSPALAQGHGSNDARTGSEPINAMCPIGKEPIVPSAGAVEYKGKTIGLCCPGCGKQFLAWDEPRKDEFVALAIAHREPGTEHAEPARDALAKAWTDPFSLDTCPVSGQRLGSMGEPVVKTYDGREVRFCCATCTGKFETDLAASWKMVDEAIVRDQLRYYPTQTCVVSGEPLVDQGEDIATNVVYGNRLVRLCCKMCEREFKADPTTFVSKLDHATAEAQRADYPLTTCIVSGGALGSMGDPTEMVIAGRLMRFCCASCEPKAKSNPTKFIAEIDNVWAAKGKHLPADVHQRGASGVEGGHGDHGHGG